MLAYIILLNLSFVCAYVQFDDISYNCTYANFGPQINNIIYASATIVSPAYTCDTLANATSKIAVMLRSNCTFSQKIINAYNAGYQYVVIADNIQENLFDMSGESVPISAILISYDTYLLLNYSDFNLTIFPQSKFNNFNFSSQLIFIIFCAFPFVLLGLYLYGKNNNEQLNINNNLNNIVVPDNLINDVSESESIFEKIENSDGLTCTICIETNSLDENVINFDKTNSSETIVNITNEQDKMYCKLSKCEHIFHIKCIINWFKQQRNCPNCRQDY